METYRAMPIVVEGHVLAIRLEPKVDSQPPSNSVEKALHAMADRIERLEAGG